MATVNLGRIKPVFRGAYNNSTSYVVDDIVTHGNETFIAIQAGSGNATSNASYWTKLAAKGADGSDGTDLTSTLTTQGDILIRNSSGLARLGYGTSGHFLKTQGSGADPVWAEAGGGILVSVQGETDAPSTTSSTNTSFVDTGANVVITPASSSNHIWINYNFKGSIGGGAGQYRIVRTVGGSDTTIVTIDIGASQTRIYNRWYKDSPSTTSAITYKLQMKSTQGNQGHTIYVDTATQVNWFLLQTSA